MFKHSARKILKWLNPSRMRVMVFCLVLGTGVFSHQVVIAQTGGKPLTTEEKVTQLLAEIEAKNKTRAVYTADNFEKLANVPHANRFTTVRRKGNWDIVRFDRRTVPGWVSSDFITETRGRAIVTADTLNVRLRPSVDAPVLTQVPAGYESRIQGRSSGFIRILLPTSYEVAVKASEHDNQHNAKVADASVNREQLSATPATNASVPTSPRTQASVSIMPAASTAAERQHLIAPGDALSLLVFGEPDLSIENVRVPQSGRVSFPLIGSVRVANKTTSEVEESVAALLSQGYVRNPRLSVTIFSYRPIFIRGAVSSTGAFPYTEGLTIAKAIALAGGSKNSAKRDGVSIIRDGETVEEGLSIDSLQEIKSGDVITVNEEVGVSEDQRSFIYIHGEVVQPGEYVFRRGLTVEKAIVLASGFNLRASKKKINITRYAGTQENQEPVKMKRVELYTPVEPGDVINVGASWF